MTLRPDWPAPPGVQALCSTREGGVSAPPWDSLNLGDHVGDDPAAVATNRARFAAQVGVRPVFLQQVHGTRTVLLDAQSADGLEADACVSTVKGIACTIMVADCLPILLCDLQGQAVAAAHAGWRGLAGKDGHGVIESVFDALVGALGGTRQEVASRLLVWLGPCIGPRAFEVGPEVKAAFESLDPQATALFEPHAPGKWLGNLPELARRRLQALGITRIHGNDGSPSWCTVTHRSWFFSHRRDRISGRFAASVWLA